MRWIRVLLFHPLALALGIVLRVLDWTSRRKHHGQPYPDAAGLWRSEDQRVESSHPVQPSHLAAPQPERRPRQPR